MLLLFVSMMKSSVFVGAAGTADFDFLPLDLGWTGILIVLSLDCCSSLVLGKDIVARDVVPKVQG